MFRFFKRWLRRSAEPRPFPPEYRAILDANVPILKSLSEAEAHELERLVLAFLDDKVFEGAGGLEMTDEIRLTIAAQACLLLLHRDTDVYPDLDTIVVYPSTYVSPSPRHEGPVVIEGGSARLGESWERGVVVLAWDVARRNTRNVHDGHNVILHEFAHQLDHEGGAMDGAPELGTRARYATWARVLGEEYEDLVARVESGRPADIDGYAAQSPPEFFAVITEVFFEQPQKLRARHPELYATLADFYRQDPASWPA